MVFRTEEEEKSVLNLAKLELEVWVGTFSMLAFGRKSEERTEGRRKAINLTHLLVAKNGLGRSNRPQNVIVSNGTVVKGREL